MKKTKKVFFVKHRVYIGLPKLIILSLIGVKY